jgi:hypothetical protein
VSKALGLEFRFADLRLGNSFQIGLWSADFVPVILATEAEPKRFRWIVAELAARLRGAFILLAPTSGCLDAVTQEILAHARAGFFDLQSHLALGPQGELYPDQAPGQLFAAFTPQPKEPLDEDVARRAFALVQQFDAPTLAVFKFYCLEGLSGSQVARRCHCSKATVMARLKTIRRKTGMHPLQLRRLSPQVGKLEEQMSDSRARRLYRRRFIDDDSSDGRDDV